VLRGRLAVTNTISDFLYLHSGAEVSESLVETVPNGVVTAVDGILAVPVATDAGPLQLRVELHDRRPPPLPVGAGDDIATLAWRPLGNELGVTDTVGFGDGWLALGPGDELLAVEVCCRGRDEAATAGVGGDQGAGRGDLDPVVARPGSRGQADRPSEQIRPHAGR
jgi:hypothetical protein